MQFPIEVTLAFHDCGQRLDADHWCNSCARHSSPEERAWARYELSETHVLPDGSTAPLHGQQQR